jgi:hypothetical protein
MQNACQQFHLLPLANNPSTNVTFGFLQKLEIFCFFYQNGGGKSHGERVMINMTMRPPHDAEIHLNISPVANRILMGV